jgi:hypothetical protein
MASPDTVVAVSLGVVEADERGLGEPYLAFFLDQFHSLLVFPGHYTDVFRAFNCSVVCQEPSPRPPPSVCCVLV